MKEKRINVYLSPSVLSDLVDEKVYKNLRKYLPQIEGTEGYGYANGMDNEENKYYIFIYCAPETYGEMKKEDILTCLRGAIEDTIDDIFGEVGCENILEEFSSSDLTWTVEYRFSLPELGRD